MTTKAVIEAKLEALERAHENERHNMDMELRESAEFLMSLSTVVAEQMQHIAAANHALVKSHAKSVVLWAALAGLSVIGMMQNVPGAWIALLITMLGFGDDLFALVRINKIATSADEAADDMEKTLTEVEPPQAKD
jgi:hypothetical protein